MADLSQLERAFVKADEAGNTEDAAAFAAEIKRMRAAPAAPKPTILDTWPAPPVRETNPVMTFGADVLTGATGLMRGSLNLASDVYNTMRPRELSDLISSRVSNKWGDQIFPPAEGSAGTVGRTIGALADPVALGIGGAVTKAMPYVPLAGKGFVEGVKAVGRNFGSGSTAGGIIGALSDDSDATTGSIVGGVANVVVPPLVTAVGKGTGAIIDILTGKHPTVKAADILRQAAGKDLPSIRAATAAASPDLTAAQAAYGINNNTWNALGELAARNDKESFFSRLGDRQKADMIDAVRKIAGGANQTEARQTMEATKQALNQVTGPMREAELGAANTAGTKGRELAGRVEKQIDSFVSALQDKGRFQTTAAQQANLAEGGRSVAGNLSPSAYPVMGQPRIPPRYTENILRVPEATAAAADATGIAANRSAQAGLTQYQLDSLAAHGLTPIDTSKITGSLAAKLNSPSLAGNSVAKRVLSNVSDIIDEWTKRGGGVIDAEALYAIRKNAVNSEIETMMGSAAPKVKAQYASKLLSTVRPYIDEAIIKAGGTGWKDYLRTFEQGMTGINQQKLGAKALDLLERSPKKFESLAAGNEPKIVQKIFDTEYDIAKAMGSKVQPINEVAARIARDRAIKEGAAKGEGALAGILSENVAKFKLPNWINAKISIANRALDVLEGQVNKKTMNTIYEAMRSGKSANELLDVIPAKERIAVINAMVTGQPKGGMLGSTVSGVLSGSASED